MFIKRQITIIQRTTQRHNEVRHINDTIIIIQGMTQKVIIEKKHKKTQLQ